jgi:serine/threonine-protein kinase HipA
VPSDHKYQTEGGPNLKDCFALLRRVSSRPVVDLAHLLDAVIFNMLIGNHDAHGKNFSLLYHNSAAQLAPLYDLVSTVYYPELSKKMAMKIGKEPESDKIMPAHFERLAEDAGLAKPMVRKRVPELAEQTRAQLENISIDYPITDKLADLIAKRCELFLARFR